MPYYNDETFALDDTSQALLDELGETPAIRAQMVKDLQNWIAEHKGITCRSDEDFLVRFMRASKFNLEATKKKIETWCIARSSKAEGTPKWFLNQSVRDTKLRALLNTGFLYIMPALDDKGRIIMYMNMDKLQNVSLDPIDFIRCFIFVCEYGLFKYERCQVHGVLIIQNGTSHNLWIVAYWTPDKIARAINLKAGFPVRLKRVEFHNMHAIFRSVLNTALRLTSKEIQQKMKFYARIEDAVWMPPECRPKCLRGTGPDWEDIKDEFLERLDNFQEEYDSFKSCYVEEGKVAEGCSVM